MFRKALSFSSALFAVFALMSTAVFASDAAANPANAPMALTLVGAAVGLGLVGLGVGVGMGLSVSKAVEASGRNPESTGKVQTLMILGLAFLETVVIYSLTVALLLMFASPIK